MNPIIISAPPAGGKTETALKLAIFEAYTNPECNVIFYNDEESISNLRHRLFAREPKVRDFDNLILTSPYNITDVNLNLEYIAIIDSAYGSSAIDKIKCNKFNDLIDNSKMIYITQSVYPR